MENLIFSIKKIAERISKTEEKRAKLADFLAKLGPEIDLTRKVPETNISKMKIMGVDGGIAKKSLHGFDFMLVRAGGVCFQYENNKINIVEYFPSKFPTPEPNVFESLSEIDWNYISSIVRLKKEINTANASIKKLKPDIVMLDGLIVPHYLDRPSKSSFIYKNYEKLIQEYKDLYETIIKNNLMLVGIVEDSRSVTFCNFVKDEILSQIKHSVTSEIMDLLNRSRDTNLLYLVLKKGERSKIFRYSKNPSNHPVLKDMKEHRENIYCFYLKTAKWDRPLRIDTLIPANEEKEKYIDKLASIILSVSGQHSGYGLPAPLIEADNIAKLSDTEIENFYSQVLSFAGNSPSIMKLRREQRPF